MYAHQKKWEADKSSIHGDVNNREVSVTTILFYLRLNTETANLAQEKTRSLIGHIQAELSYLDIQVVAPLQVLGVPVNAPCAVCVCFSFQTMSTIPIAQVKNSDVGDVISAVAAHHTAVREGSAGRARGADSPEIRQRSSENVYLALDLILAFFRNPVDSALPEWLIDFVTSPGLISSPWNVCI